MKKTIFIVSLLLIISLGATQAQNVFKKYGFKKEVLTLSKGKYQEIFKNDEVMQVGTVLINTKTNKVVKLLNEDTTKTTYNAELSSRFLTIDPLAEKYYNISPYAFCANNPIKFVDPDGKEINLYNIVNIDNRGNPIVQNGLSAKTQSAMKDLMKTAEGRAFFSQFAKAGDVVGGVKFTKDGALSNVTLNLWDYSYEKGETPPYVQSNSGSIKPDDKETVTLKVVSSGAEKTEIGETLTHETQVHGYEISKDIQGKGKTSENQDHKALKNQNTKHQGYKQYKSVQNQLQTIDNAYKKAFQEAQKQYNENY